MIMIVKNKEVINRMKFDRNDIDIIEINFQENNIDAFTKAYWTNQREWVASYNLTEERVRKLETILNNVLAVS